MNDYTISYDENGNAHIIVTNNMHNENIMPSCEQLLFIDFTEKKNNGALLNRKEEQEFYNICMNGADQLIECYSNMPGKFSKVDCMYLCRKCDYYIRDNYMCSKLTFPTKEIYDPKYISKLFAKYLVDRNTSKSCVYFISNSRTVKIGKADNVQTRVSDFVTPNQDELTLICTLPCATSKMARELETELHKLYKRNQFNHEWFCILDKIDTLKFREWFGIDKEHDGLYSAYLA